MIPPKTKEILDLVVSICSIVSCVAAVYGVFQVVEFVVDVRPIIIPIVKEVKEGNVDVRKILYGTTIRHDTVRAVERDTIYIRKDKDGDKRDLLKHRRLTEEEAQSFGKSEGNVSEQEEKQINKQEDAYRQRMQEKMK